MSRNGYACEQGKWPKAQDIYNELHELTSKPIYCVSDAAYKDIVENYFDKNARNPKQSPPRQNNISPAAFSTTLLSTNPSPCAW